MAVVVSSDMSIEATGTTRCVLVAETPICSAPRARNVVITLSPHQRDEIA